MMNKMFLAEDLLGDIKQAFIKGLKKV